MHYNCTKKFLSLTNKNNIIAMNLKKLDAVFERYGYDLKHTTPNYRIYVLPQGMYYGAEIVPIDTDEDLSSITEQYSKLGYACKINHFADEKAAEDYLFKGFFQTQLANKKIEKRYSEFAQKQIRHYGDKNIKYEYIHVPYISNDIIANNEVGQNIIQDVGDIIKRQGAHLIVIEAAAGFGKTCTAFELFYSFKNRTDFIKPLFTELSRNREAKKFKYVLWSEIESEYNSLIKSDLVIYNIQQGKIPLIIDGFDELLSKNIDTGKGEKINDFEQVETMLSTIGELLKSNAKIILTSRKTAIFSGEEFNSWVESYENAFSVIRFQIEKPEVKHWLPRPRLDELYKQQVPLEHISNPVLLTYLRNICDEDFCLLMKDPDSLVDKYFEYLLTREQERQNLVIPPKDQLLIFKNLTKSFALFDVACETRSFVKELIIDENDSLLKHYRTLSPSKPTLEELADTLTNHALLDRIGNNDYIGFINEFIHGILFGEVLLSKGVDFLEKEVSLPEDLLERAIVSFSYEKKEKRELLWEMLNVLKLRLSSSLKMLMDTNLKNLVYGQFKSASFNSINFQNISFIKENCNFDNCIFTDSKFDNCIFDVSAFVNTGFIGCKFINCTVQICCTDSLMENNSTYCYGCEDFGNDFISDFSKSEIIEYDRCADSESVIDYEQIILSKYFRVDGKTPRMKLISLIKEEIPEQEREYAFEIFYKLKKAGYIRTNGNNSHISQEGIIFYNKTYR